MNVQWFSWQKTVGKRNIAVLLADPSEWSVNGYYRYHPKGADVSVAHSFDMTRYYCGTENEAGRQAVICYNSKIGYAARLRFPSALATLIILNRFAWDKAKESGEGSANMP